MASDEISLEESTDIMENENNKKKTFWKNLKIYLWDYSDKTTIYGLKYFNEPNRPKIEKLYWLFVIIFCLVFCSILINQSWHKLNESPIVNFVQKPTPIWQVPFPAVTVCSETKAKKSIFNFTNYFNRVLSAIENSVTDEELQKFSDTSLLCDNHLFNKGNNTTQNAVIDHILNIAPEQEEVLLGCSLNAVNKSCKSLFSPVLTDEGICFTFNMLNFNDFFTNYAYLHNQHFAKGKLNQGWSLDKGYPRSVGKDTYPRRALEGIKNGMYLLLMAKTEDLDFICRGPIQGFKVLLHHPAEVPRLDAKFVHVPLNQSVVLSVKPEVVTSSEDLKSYEPHQRGCFFSEEKALKFFQVYSQENCHAECVANYTLAKCNCVAYYMPRENSTEICGSGSTKCLYTAHKEFFHQRAESEINAFNSDGTLDSSPECDCLPSCTTIAYNTEITHTDFHWSKTFEAFGQNASKLEGIMLSRFTLFFKERQFLSTERRKLYNKTEFLANCGGLLALFIGFSIFSVFEIIYFLSVRLVSNVRKYGSNFWSGCRNLNGRYLHQ